MAHSKCLTNDDEEEEEEKEEGEEDNDDDENILKSVSKFNGKKRKCKQRSSYFPSITRECKLYVSILILFLQLQVSKSPT